MRIHKRLHLALNKISDGFGYIDSRDVQCGSEHAYRLPMGKSAYDVEKRLETLIAAAGAPVELIDRGGAVVVRVVEKDFPAKLPFKEEDLKNGRLLIGYNRLFKPIYHRPMHILAGGASRAGKTVWLRWMLYQLARAKAIVKVADLKAYSFFPFETLPGFQIAKSLEETADMLHEAMIELERRQNIVLRSRDREALKNLPYYVVVIDEAAQIAPKMYSSRKSKGSELSPKDYATFCDECVARISQKGGESRVILIYCTQRPDASIINGQVKSNVEAAIAFRTYSGIDSRIILNTEGAEKISVTTPGRCLFRGDQFHALQVPFIGETDREWEKLLAPLKVEVLQHGSSRRSTPQRISLDGSFRSTDRDNETDRNVKRFVGPEKESIKDSKGTRAREANRVEIPRTREDMVSQQKGKKVASGYTDEVPD